MESETTFTELPHLRLVRRIGSGATAQVYEARRETDGEKIALKVVSLQALEDDSARTRVKREAQALQTLRHPSIVRLFQFHESKENLFLELEFVDGTTLNQWVEQNLSPLTEPKVWILSQLAQALAAAHMDGTIHRDLKPENILISKEGDVKLTDFGLAKPLQTEETQPGLLVGSLAYMAPELLNDGKSSFASDIFSFGVIGYELLMGQHPFPHQDVKTLLENLYSNRKLPLASHLPARLENLFNRCLKTKADERPSSLWEIYAELMVVLQESGQQKYCKSLVHHKAAENGILAKALEQKYANLKSQIASESNSPTLDKKKLVQLINEFAFLFPNDSAAASYLSLLREKRSHHWPKIAAALLLLLPGMYFFTRTEAPLPPPPIATPEPAIASPPPAEIAETKVEPPPPTPKITKPTPPPTGTLSLRVPADVRVFIDGKRYGNSKLKAIQLESGIHQLLLERDGFQPIEQSIKIKKGRVTRINVGGTDES